MLLPGQKDAHACKGGNPLNIRQKLVLGFLTVSLLVIFVAYSGIDAVDSIHNAYTAEGEQTLPVISALTDMKIAGIQVIAATHEYIHLQGNENSLLLLEKEHQEGWESYGEAFGRYELLVNRFFPDEKDYLEKIRIAGQKLNKISFELIDLKKQDAPETALTQKHTEFEEAQTNFQKAVDDALAAEENEFAKRTETVGITIDNTRKTIIFASLLTVIISVLIGIYISYKFTKPVLQIKDAAVELGKGNLSTRVNIDSGDEFGILSGAFNVMASELKQYHDHLDDLVTERTFQLVESEEMFKSIFDNALDGIILADTGTKKFLMGNKKMCEMLGLGGDELKNLGISDLHLEKDLPYVLEQFEKQARGETDVAKDIPVKRKDGSIFYADIKSGPVIIGGRTYLTGIFRDITERRQNENQLKSQNEFIKLVIDSLSHPFYVINVNDYTIAMANAAGSAMGEDATCYAVSHKKTTPCENEGHPCPLEDVKRTRKPVRVEHVHHDRDGNPRNVEVYCYPIFDPKGNVVQVIEYSLDITERRQAEEALRQSEDKYHTLYDSSSDAIMLLDEKGFFNCNNATLRMFGFSKKEDFTKVHPSQVSPPYQPDGTDSLTAANERIAQALRTGTNHFEWVHRRQDGEDFPADVLLTSFNLKGKQVLQATVRDITELKRAEGELRAARDEALRASAVKSDFLMKMSHELRTPLNAVMGFSELLKTKELGELNEKQEKYVENIHTSGKHLLSIISDMLDLVKVESGEKLPLNIESFNVQETMDEILRFADEKAEQKNITLKKDIDMEPGIISADKLRFKQVLMNLLGNAIKFSKPEGGTVTITARKIDDMVQFSISDTGIGIKEEDMGKLFSLFHQVDSGTSRKYGGTGIGLSICKQIVELHGGKIWAESTYGEGSTFTFTLPLKAKMEGGG
ncbi:MAG: PAS domain S-box protein [Candidatus Methanoperedens sp.]|jgi:PAS domain S-box-containing protein|nr:PAS domain S-box protein [Candidatus Methanoperedens sp.]